ncbi:MAG: exodeoxyribonuclease VII large subunit [Candidatus Marinimicrobia bacterium]|nr:exodeoxyribonuclease VII large subunit [Candidatus Neomarinimicrobiota bacterium]
MDGLFYDMNNQLIYTVTQINNYSADLLKKELSNVWVSGEISSLKKYPSGFAYLTLKDSISELSCISNHEVISNIEVGMEVTVNGSIDIYTIKGNYQFRINNVFLKGKGNLWLKYNKLKDKLSKEGLFDMKYKKKLPPLPQNVGIITSKEGSVLSDIRNIVNRRSPYVSLFVMNTKVSGQNAVASICESIKNFKELKFIDVIIVARGGGSIEDLSVFNEEKLVREIFKLNTPVISAIGHETDFTLCDFASDLRASTPSEAAQLCCISTKELLEKICYDFDKIISKIQYTINNKQENLSRIDSVINKKLEKNMIINKQERVEFFFNLIQKRVFNKKNFLLSLIKSNQKVFKKYDDYKIKKLGYSIIKKNNTIITDIDKLNKNDNIEIDMFNGSINAKIKELKKNEK